MKSSYPKAWINLRDFFIKTNVIGDYANLLLGHRIEEQVKRMRTPAKLQNSTGAQQNAWKQTSISVLQNQCWLFSIFSALICFSKILPNLKKVSNNLSFLSLAKIFLSKVESIY